MKEKIQQMTQAISEKGDRLKEKVERNFSNIMIPSYAPVSTGNSSIITKTPPVSYLLYGAAALFAVGALSSDSKILCTLLAATSAYGGYRLSQINTPASNSQYSSQHVNVNSQKNEITTKVIDIVKKTTQEWEEFMELKQKEIKQVISLSDLPSSEKDEMISKVFLYEIIDINLLDFSDSLTNVISSSEINAKIEAYKIKMLNAIDGAITKQIAKYNSVC